MQRINNLCNLLRQNDVDSALILSRNNRLYFSGFDSSDGAVLFTKNEVYFLVDFRYFEAAKKEVKNIKVIKMDKFSETLAKLTSDNCIKNILIEQNFVTLSRFNLLKSIFAEAGVTVENSKLLDDTIDEMRLIKTEEEIAKIQTAQEISEFAFGEILKEIKVGISEKEIAAKLEYLIRKEGASGSAFDLIVLSGKNTSLPHGVPSEKQVETGDFITIDMGAIYKGYKSDMTRTFAVGNITKEQKDVYNIVLNAQKNALAKIKPGLACNDLDKVARDVIERTKFKGTFGHSLGHGVGLNIHEAPSISSNNRQKLKEGMVLTIEPGIYLENHFGVRIEDLVVVTKNGRKNLAKVTKELLVF